MQAWQVLESVRACGLVTCAHQDAGSGKGKHHDFGDCDAAHELFLVLEEIPGQLQEADDSQQGQKDDTDEIADITLVDDEIRELPHLLALSRRMMTTIKLNLTFSMALNFLAITLAITGLLGPVIGALVHNAGSVVVIINSAMLLRWKQS